MYMYCRDCGTRLFSSFYKEIGFCPECDFEGEQDSEDLEDTLDKVLNEK